MKISIVMTYYKRIRELKNTLHSFIESKHDDFEVIIVDDATGDGEHDSKSVVGEYKKNPSEISGSYIHIHENSSILDDSE